MAEHHTGSIWRGIGFTLAGGIGGALIGAFEGGVSGGVLGSFIQRDGAQLGTVVGAALAAVIGAGTGLSGFTVAFRDQSDLIVTATMMLKRLALHSAQGVGSVMVATALIYPIDRDLAGKIYFSGAALAFIIGASYGMKRAIQIMESPESDEGIPDESHTDRKQTISL